jgi:AbrB family looped-hinge helix DNA binding protein
MNTILTLDRAGRIVLPKAVREELQVSPGDSLELEASEEAIVLRPARGNGRMKKEHGIWVFHAGKPLTVETVNKTVNKIRRERNRKALGRYP